MLPNEDAIESVNLDESLAELFGRETSETVIYRNQTLRVTRLKMYTFPWNWRIKLICRGIREIEADHTFCISGTKLYLKWNLNFFSYLNQYISSFAKHDLKRGVILGDSRGTLNSDVSEFYKMVMLYLP